MKRTNRLVVISFALLAGFSFLFVSGQGTKGILLLPEGISVELYSSQNGTLMLSAKDGRAELPQGPYRLESWTLEKADPQGRVWKLSGDLTTAKMINIGPEPVQLDIQAEPIACKLNVVMTSQTVNFELSLNGPNGERLRVDGPGVKRDNLPQPAFVLYNSDRSFLQTYDFQSQCCGNYRLNWTPPQGVQGPFWIDVKVTGPFTLDFQPKTLDELTEETIAKMQAGQSGSSPDSPLRGGWDSAGYGDSGFCGGEVLQTCLAGTGQIQQDNPTADCCAGGCCSLSFAGYAAAGGHWPIQCSDSCPSNSFHFSRYSDWRTAGQACSQGTGQMAVCDNNAVWDFVYLFFDAVSVSGIFNSRPYGGYFFRYSSIRLGPVLYGSVHLSGVWGMDCLAAYSGDAGCPGVAADYSGADFARTAQAAAGHLADGRIGRTALYRPAVFCRAVDNGRRMGR
ncbi:MAG TPA: hypothetical protein PKV53_10500 [Anaerohalosphaeraceae bacterium]|nr:hypothetical protein [Anaerohalosphaeraceae bacterium]